MLRTIAGPSAEPPTNCASILPLEGDGRAPRERRVDAGRLRQPHTLRAQPGIHFGPRPAVCKAASRGLIANAVVVVPSDGDTPCEFYLLSQREWYFL
jgi:hypothetical protein